MGHDPRPDVAAVTTPHHQLVLEHSAAANQGIGAAADILVPLGIGVERAGGSAGEVLALAAEHPAEGVVGLDDPAVQVDDGDADGGIAKNRLLAGHHLAHLPLAPLMGDDVVHRHHDTDDGIADLLGRHHIFDRNVGAVGPAEEFAGHPPGLAVPQGVADETPALHARPAIGQTMAQRLGTRAPQQKLDRGKAQQFGDAAIGEAD